MRAARYAWIPLLLALPLAPSPTTADTSDAELWRAVGVSPAATPVKAPAFRLRALTGHAVSLDQFRGRVVMLYFWATW